MRCVFGSGFAGGACFSLQRLAGLADLLDPALLVRHPLGHLVPTPLAPVLPILRIVGGLGPIEPGAHFPLQAQLRPAHPLIAHRLVLARVGLHLRTIERHVPELDQPRLLTQQQHLHEQPLQRPQVALAKIARRAKVRPVQSRHRHEVRVRFPDQCDALASREVRLDWSELEDILRPSAVCVAGLSSARAGGF